MKPATVKQLKDELNHSTQEDLVNLCLRLSRFKKENKELLTYLLFESGNEQDYIESIKLEVDEQFEQINTNSYFYIKKSVRKILRNLKKYIRYSLNKETEVELLLYFCKKLNEFQPSISNNVTLTNLFKRQLAFINNKIEALHEDLQYDFNILLNDLDIK
jgi:phosphoglycerate-specific signal transduction histidine kinase